jgi:hypothetical protein
MTRKIPWLLAAALSAGCAAAPPAQTAASAEGAPPIVLGADACPTALPDVSVTPNEATRRSIERALPPGVDELRVLVRSRAPMPSSGRCPLLA